MALEGAAPWVAVLVGYYVSALRDGALLPAAQSSLSDTTATPTMQSLPAGTSAAVLSAVAEAVRSVDAGSAQQLMSAVAAYASRQPARSAARLACVHMQHGLLKAALAGSLCLDEQVVAGWLAPLPKLLWDLGATAPHTAAAALRLMLDAARCAPAGSPMGPHLAALQPQMVPLFAAQLPQKAAKAALAKAAEAAAAAGGSAAAVETAAAAGGACVLLPGAVAKLPDDVAGLAVDLLYHLGPLGSPLLKALAAALSSALLPWPLALRLLEVVMARLADSPDPALAAGWLLTLLFGPQHGQAVLTPDGVDVTAGLQRQAALVDAIVVRLQPFGGAGALLQALASPLASLPLADPTSAGSSAARLQRYSLIRLAAAAAEAWPGEEAAAGAGATAGEQGPLPPQLLPLLPLAVALCGLELEAVATAAAAGPGSSSNGCGSSSSSHGPAPQSAQSGLLAAMPRMALPLLQQLRGVVGSAAAGSGSVAAGGGSSRPLGGLPPVAAMAAALRLAQAATKLGPCRGLLVQEQGAVVDAVRGMVGAVVALPAGCAGGGECAAEAQRLVQGVADMLGMLPSAIAAITAA